MNIWVKSVLSGFIVMVLALFFYKIILQPNKHALYKVHYVLGSPAKINVPETMLNEGAVTIKKRITGLGYISTIKIKNNKLDVRVEDAADTILLRQTIPQNTPNTKIEFREIYTLNELPGLFTIADKVSAKIFASAKRKEKGIYSIVSPLVADEINGQNIFRPAIGSVNKKDTVILNLILHHPAVLNEVPADVQFCYGILTDDNLIRNTPDDLHLYALRTRGQKARIQNADIENATAEYNRYTNNPEIRIRFNHTGTGKWASMTKDNVNRYLVILLDDVVIMAPPILEPIPGGEVSVSGRFTREEAAGLAKQLLPDHLSAGFSILKEEISPINTGIHINLPLLLSLTFIVAGSLAFLVFNSLKNK